MDIRIGAQVVGQEGSLGESMGLAAGDVLTGIDGTDVADFATLRGLLGRKKFGDDLHGIYIFGSDIRAARNASFSSGLGQLREVCCTSDRDFDLPSQAPQSAYTPVAQEIKDKSSTYAQSAGPVNTTVALRKEAKLQGVNSVEVWDCGTQCYDEAMIEQGGADVEDEFDRRRKLAVWLGDPGNPFFARNIANRFWGYLMGRGLVEPIDDMRATNPASNPALLDALAADFVENGHDLKHLLRTVLNSRAYQLSSDPTPGNAADGLNTHFTRHTVKRLGAEVIADAVDAVRPFGVDVCSGLRTDGALDPEKLYAFFAALWRAAPDAGPVP